MPGAGDLQEVSTLALQDGKRDTMDDSRRTGGSVSAAGRVAQQHARGTLQLWIVSSHTACCSLQHQPLQYALQHATNQHAHPAAGCSTTALPTVPSKLALCLDRNSQSHAACCWHAPHAANLWTLALCRTAAQQLQLTQPTTPAHCRIVAVLDMQQAVACSAHCMDVHTLDQAAHCPNRIQHASALQERCGDPHMQRAAARQRTAGQTFCYVQRDRNSICHATANRMMSTYRRKGDRHTAGKPQHRIWVQHTTQKQQRCIQSLQPYS